MKYSPVANILKSGVESFQKRTPSLSSRVVSLMEKIIETNETDGFALWDDLNNLIGEHYEEDSLPALVSIRDQFVTDFIALEKTSLDAAFLQSPETGTRQWLIQITTSITQFNDFFQNALAQFDFPFPPKYATLIAEVKRTITFINNNSWSDTYPVLEQLSGLDFFPKDLRIHLLITMGEVQQYHYGKSYKAEPIFRKAEQLAPDHHRVLCAFGNYYLSEKKIELARAQFQKVVELYPDRASGYHGMAEVAEMKNESPEYWFREAMNKVPGDGSVYLRLARYYLKTQQQNRESEIEDLKNRLLTVAPDGEYSYWMAVGFEYFELRRYDEVFLCYQQAINIDQRRSRAFLELGYTHLASTKDGMYDNARLNFEKVVELLPDSVSGYWAMADSYSQEKRYREMLDWYPRCPKWVDDYLDKMYGMMGFGYLQLDDYAKAEEHLMKAFECDPQSAWAKFNTEQLAIAYYEKRGDREKAISIFTKVLANAGESYRASYENRIANIHYYFKEYAEAAAQYEKAIDHDPKFTQYQRNLSSANNAIANRLFNEGKYPESIPYYERAVKFDPDDDVYYLNLSGAYEQSGHLEKALEPLQKASEIKPTEGEYARKITKLQTKIALLPRYGQKAMQFPPTVTPIAVEVAANLIPLLSQGTALVPNAQSSINVIRDAIQEKFGHEKIPGIRVRGNETDLADGTYIIMLDEIPKVSGHVRTDGVLCNATVVQLAVSKIQGEAAANPADGTECSWVPAEYRETVRNLGIQTWDTAGYIMLHVQAVIEKHFSGFVTLQTVSNQLRVHNFYDNISNSVGGVPRFTTVLKALVEEGVSIRALDVITEIYIDRTAKNYPAYVIIEELRNHDTIRQSINQNLADTDYCAVYNLAEDLTKVISDSIYTSGDGALLAIEPGATQEILTSVRNEVNSLSPDTQNPVVMTKDWQMRRHVRKLLELEFPHLAVMAEREITKTIKVLATIGLD